MNDEYCQLIDKWFNDDPSHAVAEPRGDGEQPAGSDGSGGGSGANSAAGSPEQPSDTAGAAPTDSDEIQRHLDALLGSTHLSGGGTSSEDVMMTDLLDADFPDLPDAQPAVAGGERAASPAAENSVADQLPMPNAGTLMPLSPASHGALATSAVADARGGTKRKRGDPKPSESDVKAREKLVAIANADLHAVYSSSGKPIFVSARSENTGAISGPLQSIKRTLDTYAGYVGGGVLPDNEEMLKKCYLRYLAPFANDPADPDLGHDLSADDKVALRLLFTFLRDEFDVRWTPTEFWESWKEYRALRRIESN